MMVKLPDYYIYVSSFSLLRKEGRRIETFSAKLEGLETLLCFFFFKCLSFGFNDFWMLRLFKLVPDTRFLLSWFLLIHVIA